MNPKVSPPPLGLEWNCCRGPNQSAIGLVQVNDDEWEFTTSPSTASQLEQWIARRLAVECPDEGNTTSNININNNEEEEDTEDDVVKFSIRYDAHWLKCQPPSTPLFTVLGIYEDEGDPHLPIQSSYWKAQEMGPRSCSCQPPHSEWIRKEPKISMTSSTSSSSSFPPPSNDYHIRWIDLRSLDNNGNHVLSSPEQVWHCLGSLLGRQHLLNPWVVDPDEESGNGIISSSSPPPPPQMVVLVLSKSCPALRDFRVSDACPSWFFHGYAYLDEWIDIGSPSSSTTASCTQAVMYIYKRLKPRMRLTRHHPLQDDNTTLPNGCLWEIVPPSSTEDDTKQVTGKEEHQLTTYRIISPPYLNLSEEYGNDIAQKLFAPESLAIFQQEAMAIPQWTPWPETQHYSLGPNGETTWTVFPLCYCFPAHDVSQRTWVTQTRPFCPQTCALLESILGDTLRTALFSQLRPQTTLEAHTGWADLANAVLRLHIPLVVPDPDYGLCGTWVDGCIETHQMGRPLLFDDSKIHRAFNYSNHSSRIVLIVDLARPPQLPLGYATGGHSDELDQFIAQMSVPK